MDQFPKTRRYKAGIIIGTGVILFLLGLTMTTNGGVYMLQVMDHYSGGWNVLIIAFVEVICVGWVYGKYSHSSVTSLTVFYIISLYVLYRVCFFCVGFMWFREDIGIMLGDRGCWLPWKVCSWWWGLMWCFVTPALVLVKTNPRDICALNLFYF